MWNFKEHFFYRTSLDDYFWWYGNPSTLRSKHNFVLILRAPCVLTYCCVFTCFSVIALTKFVFLKKKTTTKYLSNNDISITIYLYRPYIFSNNDISLFRGIFRINTLLNNILRVKIPQVKISQALILSMNFFFK